MGAVLRCHHCGYEWTTKGDHIPAKCPSCQARIHGTERYEYLGESFQGRHIKSMGWGPIIAIVIIMLVFIGWIMSLPHSGSSCTEDSNCPPNNFMCVNNKCVECCVEYEYCREDTDCSVNAMWGHTPRDKCINNKCITERSNP